VILHWVHGCNCNASAKSFSELGKCYTNDTQLKGDTVLTAGPSGRPSDAMIIATDHCRIRLNLVHIPYILCSDVWHCIVVSLAIDVTDWSYYKLRTCPLASRQSLEIAKDDETAEYRTSDFLNLTGRVMFREYLFVLSSWQKNIVRSS
jgi:hypothetical protein